MKTIKNLYKQTTSKELDKNEIIYVKVCFEGKEFDESDCTISTKSDAIRFLDSSIGLPVVSTAKVTLSDSCFTSDSTSDDIYGIRFPSSRKYINLFGRKFTFAELAVENIYISSVDIAKNKAVLHKALFDDKTTAAFEGFAINAFGCCEYTFIKRELASPIEVLIDGKSYETTKIETHYYQSGTVVDFYYIEGEQAKKLFD